MSSVATVLALFVAVVAWLLPRDGDPRPVPAADGVTASAAPDAEAVGSLARSPWLGLELYQASRRVPLAVESLDVPGSGRDEVVVATLSSAPFEIRFESLQHSDEAVAITAWVDPSIFRIHAGQFLDDTPFLGWGRGMAQTRAGSGWLVLTNDAMNYYPEQRVAPADADPRRDTIVIRDLRNRYDSGVEAGGLERPWGSVYLVVHRSLRSSAVEEPAELRLDMREVEFLRLDFES